MSDTESLVTMEEIAKRLGVKPDTVRQWRKRWYLKFPEATIKTAGGAKSLYWHWPSVVFWASTHRPELLKGQQAKPGSKR